MALEEEEEEREEAEGRDIYTKRKGGVAVVFGGAGHHCNPSAPNHP